MDIKVLGEEVIYQKGPVKSVKRYIAGVHPELGTIHQGWSGWETIIETTVVKATHTFKVVPAPNDSGSS